MIEISDKAKVRINWKVTPYDYSKEKANEIQVAFARKYNIPKDNVRVIPDFIIESIGSGGGIMSEVTTDNIQDPEFHKKLYLEYLKINNIQEYDIEIIDSININSNR